MNNQYNWKIRCPYCGLVDIPDNFAATEDRAVYTCPRCEHHLFFLGKAEIVEDETGEQE